jgi:hypothetical protein
MKLPVLFYFTFLIEGIAGGLGAFRFQRLTKPLRLLVALIMFWIFAGIVEHLIAQRNIHNLWISQINNVIEMIVFTWIYYSWRTSKRNGNVVTFLLAAFLSIWSIAKFTFEPLTGADDFTWALSRLIQLYVGAVMLIHILKDNAAPLWYHDPKFIVTSSFVLYAAGTFFLFSLFTPMLHASIKLFRMIYQVNWVFIIISHILFLRAFFCKQEPASETDNENVAGTVV